jgi:single-stranded-DNA-specific exonuclease
MKSAEMPRSAPPVIRRRPPGAIDRLPSTLHPVLRRVYAARGISDADELALELRRLLPVSTLDGIAGATELLLSHLARGSRILVAGDFDADGATSTAVVMRQLNRLGHRNLTFRVPDRMRHGYGLTPALVAELADERAELLITVDNGVAAFAGIEAAQALGIEVLVTDREIELKAVRPAVEWVIAQEAQRVNEGGLATPLLAWVVHLRVVAGEAEKWGSETAGVLKEKLARHRRMVGEIN